MPGESRLREHVVEAAEAARNAIRELVQSTTGAPVSVERVIEIESEAHLAIGEAGQAARILAKERERDGGTRSREGG